MKPLDDLLIGIKMISREIYLTYIKDFSKRIRPTLANTRLNGYYPLGWFSFDEKSLELSRKRFDQANIKYNLRQ